MITLFPSRKQVKMVPRLVCLQLLNNYRNIVACRLTQHLLAAVKFQGRSRTFTTRTLRTLRVKIPDVSRHRFVSSFMSTGGEKSDETDDQKDEDVKSILTSITQPDIRETSRTDCEHSFSDTTDTNSSILDSSDSDSDDSSSDSSDSDTNDSDSDSNSSDSDFDSSDSDSDAELDSTQKSKHHDTSRLDLSSFSLYDNDGIVIYPDEDRALAGKEILSEETPPSAPPPTVKDYDLRTLLHKIQRLQSDKEKRHREERDTMMSVEELVKFLQEQNARDICVIELPPDIDYVRHFVVCSGLGTRHIGRMADNLVAELRLVRLGKEQRRIRTEGRESEDWMAVNLGSMVVHFMLEETREKMELEKLWTLGQNYDDQYRSMLKNWHIEN